MTVDLADLRAHVGAGPSDDDLQRLLDAALEAVESRYGPDGTTTREYLRPFGQWVRLGRRASAVESVIEGTTALDDTDYELWNGGRYVRRLHSDVGTAWTGMVDILYTPLTEHAERDRIVIALVDIDATRQPGLTGITVGPWSEQYSEMSEDEYLETREAILGSLRPRMASVH